IVYAVGTDDGTAKAGTDYTETGGFVLFGDGDTTPRTFTIPVADDHTVGNGSKTVQLALFNPLNVAADSPIKTATLTIMDAPPSADVGVTQSASVPTASVGQTVVFTLTITNHGPDA